MGRTSGMDTVVLSPGRASTTTVTSMPRALLREPLLYVIYRMTFTVCACVCLQYHVILWVTITAVGSACYLVRCSNIRDD